MKRRSVWTFFPRRTSITSSVGTTTCSITSSRPCVVMASSIASLTFFSKFESTLTEYQRFAILLATSVSSGSPARSRAAHGAYRQTHVARESPRASNVRRRDPYAPKPRDSRGDAEDRLESEPDDQIDEEEEQRENRSHDHDHDGRGPGLPPGRPGHLGD